MTALDVADIQGDILRAYGNAYDCTTYVFVAVGARIEPAREWFAGLIEHVTTAEPWTAGKPETTLNVALTAAGLRALGVGEALVETFSFEFREGMAARAGVLGDDGPSAPAAWEDGLGAGAAHVLLVVNAQTPRTSSGRSASCARRSRRRRG